MEKHAFARSETLKGVSSDPAVDKKKKQGQQLKKLKKLNGKWQVLFQDL